MKLERRTIKTEIRKQPDGRKLRGYAALFNSLSEDLGGFRELIETGAFDGCMNDDVRCLVNHDSNLILGRTESKTLSINVDQRGLYFECDPPATSYAGDLIVSMDRGDVDQCSFSFDMSSDDADWEETDTLPLRHIKKITKLYDVSVVTYPAYPATTSEIRSMADILSERNNSVPPMDEPMDEPDGDECQCECSECKSGEHGACSNGSHCNHKDDGAATRALLLQKLELVYYGQF